MLSRKTRYAIMSLSILAREYGKGQISIGEIARNQHIPQHFLEGILLKLKKAGILDSTRGKDGGYFLVKDPSEVTLSSVVLLVEGSLSFVSCISDDLSQGECEFCQDVDSCAIRKIFGDLYVTVYKTLSSMTLRDLLP